MGVLADVPPHVAELYLLRFCVKRSDVGLITANRRFAALISYAGLDWHPRSKHVVYVRSDDDPPTVLTSAHFNVIQSNAAAFTQLFAWFPPRAQPLPDEYRMLVRAGVNLNL